MIWCMAFVLFSTLTLLCVAIYPNPYEKFCTWVVWRFDRMRDYFFYWKLRWEEFLRERT